MLVAAGCGGASPETAAPHTLPLTASTIEAAVGPSPGEGDGCGGSSTSTGAADADARFELIGRVVTALREGACAPVTDEQRLCRSLFLIGATDPLAGLGAGLTTDQVEQLADWHAWVLAEAATAADLSGDAAAARAIRALQRIDVSGAILAGAVGERPPDLADAAIARADATIINPLVAAEARCADL